MYDESTPVINPDPTKYALSENGIERLPRQCCGCKSLFTPVNDDQRYCEYCCPDPVVVPIPFNVAARKTFQRVGFIKPTKEQILEYNSAMSTPKRRIKKLTNEGNIVGAAKWTAVKEEIKKRYKNREPIMYQEIVDSIFKQG